MVKGFPREYKYPPEMADAAGELVLMLAERLGGNGSLDPSRSGRTPVPPFGSVHEAVKPATRAWRVGESFIVIVDVQGGLKEPSPRAANVVRLRKYQLCRDCAEGCVCSEVAGGSPAYADSWIVPMSTHCSGVNIEGAVFATSMASRRDN